MKNKRFHGLLAVAIICSNSLLACSNDSSKVGQSNTATFSDADQQTV